MSSRAFKADKNDRSADDSAVPVDAERSAERPIAPQPERAAERAARNTGADSSADSERATARAAAGGAAQSLAVDEVDEPVAALVETSLEVRDGAIWVAGQCSSCRTHAAFQLTAEIRRAVFHCPMGHPLRVNDLRTARSYHR
jgi:hypothetical protein